MRRKPLFFNLDDMTQDDENIMFDEMPDMFGRMFVGSVASDIPATAEQHKTYASLFDELCDKCYPERFMEPYNAKLVSAATKIYKDILQSKDDEELQKSLMHKAYIELGVKFDGSKIYHYLMEYLNPHLYLEPFAPDKLETANKYYPSIEENKWDYIALENIQAETQWFIDEIKKEREEKRKEEEKAGMNEEQHAIHRFENDKQWLDDVRNSLGEENWRRYVEEEYGGYIKV